MQYCDDLVSTPIIFFSGLDRTGKTTTRKRFSVVTNQKYITFDRSPIDNVVYDEMFRNKVMTKRGLRTYIKKFARLGKIYIVHMTLDYEEINRRTKATEGSEYPMQEIVGCDALFTKYFDYAERNGIEMIRVQCDDKNVDDIVDEIVSKIGGTK